MTKLLLDDLFEAFKFTDSETLAYIDSKNRIHYEKSGGQESTSDELRIYLPPKSEFSEYSFLVDFSHSIHDLALKTLLQNMIEKRARYREILLFLKENRLDELWEEYYEKKAKELLIEWAKENEIEIKV